jgi:LmbE family N-acetylglucosaminyl deacetylase
MCHVANGNLGHAVIPPDELREIRTKEAEAAGKLIGAVEVLSLDVNDLEIDASNRETIEKMVAVIRNAKPDLIITHSPEDYMKDHVEVGKLVFDASFTSSVPHIFTENAAYGKIVPIFYMDTLAGVNFLPTEYVDISETIQTKTDAVDRHQSQVKWMLDHDRIDFLDFVRTVSKFRGLQCGAAYAEGFRQCMTWPRVTTTRMLP